MIWRIFKIKILFGHLCELYYYTHIPTPSLRYVAERQNMMEAVFLTVIVQI